MSTPWRDDPNYNYSAVDSSNNTIDQESPPPSSSSMNKLVDHGSSSSSSSSSTSINADDQYIINQPLQEDEMLAMESIYGDNLNIINQTAGLKCFQLNIHVEVPKGLLITAHHLNSSFQVQHLPPIRLTFLLPKSYPTTCPPRFTISVHWLGSTNISSLCRKLDSIWSQQPGHEVMYQWVEWLRASTLSYLGFHTHLLLGPYGNHLDDADADVDTRAISGLSVSPDIDIPRIKTYDAEKQNQDFCQNIQECNICLSEFAGSKFTRLPCQHFFCGECLKTFAGIHVTDGTVLKLKCPEAKCDGVIPPALLKGLLGEEEVQRWESLLLEKTLESMVDVVYCPRCETPCLQDDDGKSSQCSKCFYSFCTLCRDRLHVGAACTTPDMKLSILQERQHSRGLNPDQRHREDDMINTILSVKEILSFAKQCPRCKIAIVRNQGCNHMACRNCNENFCYKCSKPLSGYEHSMCGKEEEEVDQIRANKKNIGTRVGEQVAKMYPEHVRTCPNCGQKNVKAGNNNHILCWACQTHFCCLCRKMVRRSSEHYGLKGCKQHTAD